MKIKVDIDLSEMFSDDYDVEEVIKDIVRSDIEKSLKKSPEYKKFIERSTKAAMDKLLEGK